MLCRAPVFSVGDVFLRLYPATVLRRCSRQGLSSVSERRKRYVCLGSEKKSLDKVREGMFIDMSSLSHCGFAPLVLLRHRPSGNSYSAY